MHRLNRSWLYLAFHCRSCGLERCLPVLDLHREWQRAWWIRRWNQWVNGERRTPCYIDRMDTPRRVLETLRHGGMR